jgi:hypothetical protein
VRRRRALAIAGGVLSTGLSGCFGDAEYLVDEVRVERSPGPFSLSISLGDPKITVEGPARLRFSLTNEAMDASTIRSSPVWPFGVLGIHRENGPEWAATRFDSPAYDETDSVTMGTDGTGFRIDHRWITDRLAPKETVSETFLIHRVQSSSRRYRLVRADGRDAPGIFRYRIASDDGWTAYSPRVTFEIQRLPPHHFL